MIKSNAPEKMSSPTLSLAKTKNVIRLLERIAAVSIATKLTQHHFKAGEPGRSKFVSRVYRRLRNAVDHIEKQQ